MKIPSRRNAILVRCAVRRRNRQRIRTRPGRTPPATRRRQARPAIQPHLPAARPTPRPSLFLLRQSIILFGALGHQTVGSICGNIPTVEVVISGEWQTGRHWKSYKKGPVSGASSGMWKPVRLAGLPGATARAAAFGFIAAERLMHCRSILCHMEVDRRSLALLPHHATFAV